MSQRCCCNNDSYIGQAFEVVAENRDALGNGACEVGSFVGLANVDGEGIAQVLHGVTNRNTHTVSQLSVGLGRIPQAFGENIEA
ncbi:hypothetical protein D3C77_556440 [compost metagenome]